MGGSVGGGLTGLIAVLFIAWLTGYVGGLFIIGFFVCCDGCGLTGFEPSAFHASSKLNYIFFLFTYGDFTAPEFYPETCFCATGGTLVAFVAPLVPNKAPKFSFFVIGFCI